ncbi:TetR/AcrR family transcriptional regulator [Nocardioides speluncae]|uniref:TetR/AcrR family transcriptional regulator n=1 Tax=Nocardioides speluncae TaxID=2670337 RepID=UPI000D69C75D|nr:TetR/AcrR family transcriptional regulator [Nocardioides speluncae]
MSGLRVYAGQTASEREAGRRARLLATIHDVVGSQGYAALKVERACALAGVSTRNFYTLYANKEAAFVDLYADLTDQSVHRVLASLTETAARPMVERIPAAFLAYLEPIFADSRSARIQFVEVVGLSPQIEATRLRYRERLIELIEAEGATAVARGEVTDRDWRFAALALIGATTAIAYDWVQRPQHPPIERLERQLSALAVQLLTD